jgi:hypothetical protein
MFVLVLLVVGWLFQDKRRCGFSSLSGARQAASWARVWDHGLGGDASFPLEWAGGLRMAVGVAGCVGGSVCPRVLAFCV